MFGEKCCIMTECLPRVCEQVKWIFILRKKVRGLPNDRFIWDEGKQRVNIEKHGVTFAEASTVFDDDNALYFDDPAHSQDEDRFIILGYSERARMLLVCHCYRNGDSLIRIISARKANNKESELYGGAL